ncbi:UNVERIFIED_CONTAM: hypothetical protein GTU68_000700 [Idotea baltica]|nr:hypothetical protein [Idotea baltica]
MSIKLNKPIRLVQLSDTHLFSDSKQEYQCVNTTNSLIKVVKLIAEEQSTIDILMVTGDIAQEAISTTYENFQQITRCLNTSIECWLPGNHDDFSVFSLIEKEIFQPIIDVGKHWRIISLDTSVASHEYGCLSEQQLLFMSKAIEQAMDRYCLIALHHHPVPVGSKWLDQIALKNSREFWRMLDCYSQVKIILCGHTHQSWDVTCQRVRVLGSPSTCIQFAPLSSVFSLGNQDPGYRWLELYDNGRFDTGISRLKNKL